MKRQIVLDTETTGLKVSDGARVIEIGCIELIDMVKTGNTYRVLINPECPIPKFLTETVHGISDDMVKDAPKFRDVAEEFINFIKGSELIIHNAKFDIDMLNMELEKVDKGRLWDHVSNVICTLELDKRLFANERKHKLDAICDRLEIDRSHRTLHGALIDCDLLADVYIKINQMFPKEEIEADLEQTNWVRPEIKRYNVVLPSAKLSTQEEEAHAAFLNELVANDKVKPVFNKVEVAALKP